MLSVWLDLGLWTCRRKTTGVKCHCRHVLSSAHTAGATSSPVLTLLTRLTERLPGFSTRKLLFLPLFHTALSGRKPLCPARARGVESAARVECLCKLLRVLVHGLVVSFPSLFVYSLTYSHQCRLINVHFILWAVVWHDCVYCVAWTASGAGSFSSRRLVPFTNLSHFLGSSWLSSAAPGSSCLFPAPGLESAYDHVFKNLWFLLLRSGMRN